MNSDPFLQVQSDVLTTLESTRSLFSSYLRIRSHAQTPTSPELLQARTELESTLTDLSSDLSDLIESVSAAEQDPYRFGLDAAEVGRRRRLVEDVGREVEGMRGELQNAVNHSQNQASAKGKSATNGGLPHPSDFNDPLSPQDGDGEGDYEAWEEQRQVEMMHEQDQQLDGVFQTVGNLRQQADDMGRELEEQAGILEEVDTVADRVGGKLAGGLKRVGWVIKKNEGELKWLSRSSSWTDDIPRYDVELLHRYPDICLDYPSDLGDCDMRRKTLSYDGLDVHIWKRLKLDPQGMGYADPSSAILLSTEGVTCGLGAHPKSLICEVPHAGRESR